MLFAGVLVVAWEGGRGRFSIFLFWGRAGFVREGWGGGLEERAMFGGGGTLGSKDIVRVESLGRGKGKMPGPDNDVMGDTYFYTTFSPITVAWRGVDEAWMDRWDAWI